MTAGRLALLSVAVAVAGVAGYVGLFSVAAVRNHPEGYVAWFNFVAARVPDAPTALRVGAPAPDFTLADAAGRPVSLADYRGRKAVVLVFYRGYW
jgi:cytochrome oxidase Cu insertion factor (SCO1/SenC/PrrC family)